MITDLRAASRRLISLTVAAALLAACSSAGQQGGQTTGEPTETPTASQLAQPSAQPFDPTVEADPALVAELQAAGLDQSAATLLALTHVDTQPVGDHGYRIVESYPTGNTAVIDVTITPNQVGDPADLTVTHTSAPDLFSVTLAYFVSYDGMPADVRDSIVGASADAGVLPLAFAGLVPARGPVAQESNGARVLVHATVEQASSESISTFLGYLDNAIGEGARLENGYKQLEAGKDVVEAYTMHTEFAALEAQIAALEKCARNPTNAVSQQTYRTRPEELERLLERVQKTRDEVKANTAAMFIGLLNKTGSGLIKGAPWLSFVIGPGTAWTTAKLQELNSGLIEDLRAQIPPCAGYGVTVTAITGDGTEATAAIWGGERSPNPPAPVVGIDTTITGTVSGSGPTTFMQTLTFFIHTGPEPQAGSDTPWTGTEIYGTFMTPDYAPTEFPVEVTVTASALSLSMEWGVERECTIATVLTGCSWGGAFSGAQAFAERIVRDEINGRRWAFTIELPDEGTGTVTTTVGDTTYTIVITPPAQ